MKRVLLLSSFFVCLIAKANVRDTTLPIRRCVASLSGQASKQPLYIVNGKVIEDSIATDLIKALDAKLVDEIEVLKDAKATALYGTAAMYGVIIITTRQTNFTPKPFCKPPEYKNDNYTL